MADFLTRNRIQADATDAMGNNVLHRIAQVGGGEEAVACLQSLREEGYLKIAYLHAENNFGQTPVQVAADRHNWLVMSYLVSQAGDVFHKGNNNELKSVWECCHLKEKGMAALHRAVELYRDNRANKVVKTARKKITDEVLRINLFAFAKAGDEKMVRLVIEDRKLDPNIRDKDQRTVLHVIAKNARRVDIANYLLDRGAEVDPVDKEGATPAHVAAKARAWPMMKAYIVHGASVTIKDHGGRTVHKLAQVNLVSKKTLTEAIAEGNVARRRRLLARGEDGAAEQKQKEAAANKPKRRKSVGRHQRVRSKVGEQIKEQNRDLRRKLRESGKKRSKSSGRVRRSRSKRSMNGEDAEAEEDDPEVIEAAIKKLQMENFDAVLGKQQDDMKVKPMDKQ